MHPTFLEKADRSSWIEICFNNKKSSYVQFQKLSILIPEKGLEFPGVGFLEDQKSLRNVWSLIRISRSAGGVLEKPFFEECMDIFLSYTKQNLIKLKFWDSRLLVTIKSIRHQNFKYVNLNQYEKRKTIGNTDCLLSILIKKIL